MNILFILLLLTNQIIFVFATKNELDSISCSSCKLIIKFIKPLVDDQSVQEIQSSLKSHCKNLLVGKEACTTIAETNTEEVVQLIVDGYDDSKICQIIGMCPKTGNIDIMESIGCDICILLVGEVELKSKQDKTVQADEFCEKFVIGRSLCKEILEDYINLIIDLIVLEYSHKRVCQEVSLCKKDEEKEEENKEEEEEENNEEEEENTPQEQSSSAALIVFGSVGIVIVVVVVVVIIVLIVVCFLVRRKKSKKSQVEEKDTKVPTTSIKPDETIDENVVDVMKDYVEVPKWMEKQ